MGKSAAKRRRRKAQGDGSGAQRGAGGREDGDAESGEANETGVDEQRGPEAELEPPKDEGLPVESPSSMEQDAIAGPDSSPQERGLDVEQHGQSGTEAMTVVEGKRVLQRFFSVLMMANLPHAAIKSLCGARVAVKGIQIALASNGWKEELLPIEANALAAVGRIDPESDTVDPQPVYDIAGAIAFKVELCEFQIRAQIRTNATGKASRGRLDVQRVVSRLVNGYLSPEAVCIVPKEFGSMIEEKLGLSMGNWLTTILFARIMRQQFARNFSRIQEIDRLAFIDAFERFCLRAEFSLDCLEGQIRELVNKHTDLHKVFRDMDADGSGTISGQELVAFLHREAHVEYPVEVLMAFIKRFDTDGNGSLDYGEFVDFVRPRQFGIQVLSPFGLFYLPLDRSTPMKEVIETVRTRMFWLQHNDLLAKNAAGPRKLRESPNGAKGDSKQVSGPPKLKVTEQFRLARHFGTLPVKADEKALVSSVFENGELIVLTNAESEVTTNATIISGTGSDQCLEAPKFEYRLKPSTKRNIPLLFAHSTLLTSHRILDTNKRKQSLTR